MPTEPKPLVLIVDDDIDAAFLVRRLLSKSGIEHEPLHLTDGEQAISYLSTCGTPSGPGRKPVLMVLDLKMPKLGGFEVLDWMRAHPTYMVPVLVMTTSDDPREKARAELLKADDFLAKFPPPDVFRDILEKLFSGKMTAGRIESSDPFGTA